MLNVREMLAGRVLRVFHVPRYSGCPVHRRESVGEHLWHAVFYSDLIAQEVQLRVPNVQIDYRKLLRGAALHDLEECVVGDTVRDVKYTGDGSLAKELKAVGEQVVLRLEGELGIPLYQHWFSAKSDGVEGKILTLADLVTVTSFAIEGCRCGSEYMREVLLGNVGWIERFLFKMNILDPVEVVLKSLASEVVVIAQDYLAVGGVIRV